jgi:hypothetical protein
MQELYEISQQDEFLRYKRSEIATPTPVLSCESKNGGGLAMTFFVVRN